MEKSIQIFDGWHNWYEAKANLAKFLTSDELEKLDLAVEFTVKYHGDQKRVNGEPVSIHLLQVLEILTSGLKVKDINLLITGVLHDILEDTDVLEDEVQSNFGDRVYRLVKTLSKQKGLSGQQKTIGKQNYLSSLMNASDDVLIIKLADRYSNVQKLSSDPSLERQKAYYAETLKYIIPLTKKFPFYQELFENWKSFYGYLE